MSLHGSLETFALTDVLALLSSTHKTGELRIVGDRSQGSVWVDAGQVVQTAVPPARSHVDALFELLRLPSGMFTFEQGLPAPEPGEPHALEGLVVEAEGRLAEWRAIEAVVPSAAVAVRLQEEVGGDVRMTPEQWRMLVAAVDGGTVAAVCDRLKLGEFDACRGMRDLVNLGVVRVEKPSEPAKVKQPGKAEPVGTPVTTTVADGPEATPEADDVEAEPDAAEGVEADPLEALAAVAAAAAGSHEDAAVDDATDGPEGEREAAPVRGAAALDDQPDAGTDAEADGQSQGQDSGDDDVPLPGQPLPAWALGDEGAEDDPASDEAAALHPLATAVAGAVDAEGLEMVEGDEPINRGLLLKFLSSVRS